MKEPFKFTTGDEVIKVKGYAFPGVVVSTFNTLDGKARYVVESIVCEGMLHIFNGDQLSRK